MSFEQVSDANPDWLNRVLIRKKECDIALPPNNGLNLAPALAESRSPISQRRPARQGARRSSAAGACGPDSSYTTFTTALAAGNLRDRAVADHHRSLRSDAAIWIILGDFLGLAGSHSPSGAVSRHGACASRSFRGRTSIRSISRASPIEPAGACRPARRTPPSSM